MTNHGAKQAFPFLRNPAALKGTDFDLVVIGGGIYGAWTAYDAALRGLRVALVEKSDWGSGTSSASSKLIHGGLRYLEHYEFGLVRHALQERRTLYRIAPHLVRPLNFILPMWKGPRASEFMISAGLTLYDLLAWGSHPVQRHHHFRAAELLAEFPFIDQPRLLGGFRYGDCQEDDARMTLLVCATAQAHGAVCVNHCAVEGLLEDAGGIAGVRVRDNGGGEAFEVRARVVVNAAGPWVRAVLGDQAPKVRLIKGTHIILPAIPGCNDAFLLTAEDGRVFFVIPWYGRSLVGTTEQEVQDPSEAKPTADEARYLLKGVRKNLPGLGWTEEHVIGAFSGVRMLQAADRASLAAVSREFEVVQPKPRLIMHIGGKYTTSRGDSTEIVDAVFKAMGRKAPAPRTHELPLPGAPAEPFEQWQPGAVRRLAELGVDLEASRWLSLRHGTGVADIAVLIAQQPALRERIHPEAPFIAAEAVHAVRHEMARTLDDGVRRRTPLTLLVRDGEWRGRLEQLLASEFT
ncbi:MAG TPA: glycerol-3-phosphate dehydrogenase/oxidase [Solimonas sp.]|nr:glycerol-3-phosphate dehydrogenase/oxidase [Solimonas sp.]